MGSNTSTHRPFLQRRPSSRGLEVSFDSVTTCHFTVCLHSAWHLWCINAFQCVTNFNPDALTGSYFHCSNRCLWRCVLLAVWSSPAFTTGWKGPGWACENTRACAHLWPILSRHSFMLWWPLCKRGYSCPQCSHQCMWRHCAVADRLAALA